MNKNFSTIVFDWSGVFCLPGELFSHEIFRNFGSLDEVNLETKDIQREYYTDKISCEEFWNKVISHFKIKDIAPEEFNNAYIASPVIWPDMLVEAMEIKKHFQTILFSNLTAEMMRHIIEKYNVLDYFHRAVFSNAIGLMKPSAESFEYIARVAEKPPCDILFIDDSQTNVQSAGKLGFQTYLFTDPRVFIKDFHAD